MSAGKVLGLALLPLIVAALAPAPAKSEDVIKFAVIDNLSFPEQRGKQIIDLYTKFVTATNAAGGIYVGGTKYKLVASFDDTRADPARAAMYARKTISEGAVVIVCHNVACVAPAEESKTPLLLTMGNYSLSGKESNTFIINAPSAEDYDIQARLAIKTLGKALAQSEGPATDKISKAIRDVKVIDDTGSVRFDKAGNNAGRVTYPFRQMTGINQSGCTKSCAKTCPSDCGKTACANDGGNQCCNVCGMPLPPN